MTFKAGDTSIGSLFDCIKLSQFGRTGCQDGGENLLRYAFFDDQRFGFGNVIRYFVTVPNIFAWLAVKNLEFFRLDFSIHDMSDS